MIQLVKDELIMDIDTLNVLTDEEVRTLRKIGKAAKERKGHINLCYGEMYSSTLKIIDGMEG